MTTYMYDQEILAGIDKLIKTHTKTVDAFDVDRFDHSAAKRLGEIEDMAEVLYLMAERIDYDVKVQSKIILLHSQSRHKKAAWMSNHRHQFN